MRYAEYEINVEKLRLKRVARLGKEAEEGDDGEVDGSAAAADETGAKKDKSKGRGISSYAGPRRIFFIFERGTKKYPNEIALLWLPYIKFAKSQGAVFVLAKIYSRLLQLHPTMPAVWVMAAKYELDTHGAIRAARAIMQRGLKFNATNTEMWLEYIKLELIYVAQLLARRRVLGLITEAQQRRDQQEDDGEDLKNNKDVIELPTFTADLESKAAKELKSLPDVDVDMLGDTRTNPALRGDIALLVFDSALPELVKYTAEPREKRKILERFGDKTLDMITPFCKDFSEDDSNSFKTESAQLDGLYLGTHIIDSLTRSIGDQDGVSYPRVAYWNTILPIFYVSAANPSFTDGIKTLLDRYNKKYIKGSFAKAPQHVRIDYAGLLSDYLRERFMHDNNGSNNSKEQLEPNLLLIIKSLISKCDNQQ